MKILITGFEPFNNEKVNSALEAIRLLDSESFNADIIKLEIPTVFHKSIDIVGELVIRERPDFILAIGQAGGRTDITLERVAINIDDARIKDNEGNKPIDEKIFNDGENAYFATIPVKKIVKSLKKAGIPASISNSAGTFVCNHLMYGILYLIERKALSSRAGFVHVPYIPAQVVDKNNLPSMALEDIVRGLEVIVSTLIEREY